MKLKQVLVLLVLVALVGGGIFLHYSRINPEEYAVYSSIVNEVLESENIELVLIKKKTSGLVNSHLRQVRSGQTLRYLKQNLPEVKGGILNDFLIKNIKSWPLSKRFGVKGNYELIGDKDIEYFGGGRFSDDFYKKYPGVKLIIGFSRVGFNSKKNQALVYVELTTLGVYTFLVKENNVWVSKNNVESWME